ncbi:Predicted arabinose efflux permease, MFS family [Geodermatophilus pulveris]|uniref:Predicted arabinose efflux permease, MFS family n=1 Tax=Geodermatophilus pulveris TaxID=1564159 RepID=A0A239GCU0_9ACTN|nr:MFS transporter [Geodermatophilus pulveris]SNS66542.1 Predicted arabinose efflux permease, MFS family [Geodermatophilus pulveris]
MPAPRLSRAATFWTAAALLVLVLAASAAPSPLYRVYQERFGFSPGVLTAVFGIYAFALLAALLVIGRLSDHVGRRPVLIAGLLLQVAAGLLFLSADGVGWLLTARVVQGLSVGALTGTLGATLLDAQRSDRPRAALLNTASPGVGLALGAVAAGLAIEGLAAPTTWVFGVVAVVFSLAVLVVVLLLPETAPRAPGALASLRPRVHVPAAQRGAFLVAAPCLVALWALGGLYLSLGPSLAAGVFGVEDHLVGSLLLVAVNGTGAVASLVFWRADPHTAMLAGCLVFATGVSATVVSLTTGGTALFFTAAAVSGSGFGAAFLGAVATVTRGVAPGERGGLLSSVFVVGYLAFSVPAMLAGLAAGQVGLRPTGQVYGAAVVVLALAAAAGLLHRRRGEQRARAVERPAPLKDPLAPHHSQARGGALQGGRGQL